MGGPLSSPMRAAMPFTAADSVSSLTDASDIEARLGKRVERHRVQVGERRSPAGSRWPAGTRSVARQGRGSTRLPSRLHPFHHQQRAAVVPVALVRQVLGVVGEERPRAPGTPPWSYTARRMANSSDARVSRSPTGRSLRTMTSGRQLGRARQRRPRCVSLDRPPGTTSMAVTSGSGESGNRRRRYAASSRASRSTPWATPPRRRRLLVQHGPPQLVDALEEAALHVDQLAAVRSLGRVRAARPVRDDVRRQAPELDEPLGGDGTGTACRRRRRPRRAASRTRRRTPGSAPAPTPLRR